VIEVGVDVPNATLMVIEQAERFGLAQLHQLRGRVGRGSARSVCLLLRGEALSEVGRERLALMRETQTGFRLAEEDLRLRGGGELLGTRQSGRHAVPRRRPRADPAPAADGARRRALLVERDGGLASPRARRRGCCSTCSSAIGVCNCCGAAKFAVAIRRGRRAMSEGALYHDGNRQLQDQFGSRALADRLEEKLARTAFTDEDQAFIEGLPYFFLATSDVEGRPDCSFKGGVPGFVRVTGPSELAFPITTATACSRASAISSPTARRLAVHRHARTAEAAPGQRHGNGQPRRSADGQRRRRTADRARPGADDLSELPALRPGARVGRALDLCAACRGRSARTGWKGFDLFKDVVPPRQPTFRG
jgi:hypothetical protein